MTVAAAPSVSQPTSPRRIARVAIATINRTEGDTGVHTHTRMLAGGFKDAGVACDVVSAFSGSKKWLPVFAVRPLVLHRVNKSWSTLWHRRWHRAALQESLKRYAAHQPLDAVVAQCPVSARAALDVREALRGTFPVAMVCHFNQSEAEEYRDKGELAGQDRYEQMLAFEDKVLREVDRVIYVSNWARQNVEQSRGLRTKSSAVIWNGVDDLSSTSTPIKRSDLGLEDDDVVLINVGSLEPRKNQLGLLTLFAEVNAEFPQTRLVLVGDGAQRGEIERRIAQLELSGKVILLGHRRDVPALLPLADLYMHYATLENCPLVLIEASRASVPFAAVPNGGVPELQAALDCRIDLTPHDLREAVANVRPLLADANARRQLGRRVRTNFENTFTHRAMTQAYLKALSI